ncbi:MAG: AAA family ATPase, partial [Clostridia bacterium]|nr:AAA family ATPase [Clostridia bacterium]
MYLKSLELQGFKSFPDKTKLTFEEGTTVIVGPNGSGKSNIADAMRWVLGEISSKSMRGTKMEDIIFGGTSDRRPMGYAEVSVTFDNTDPEMRLESPYDEVTVTRRYYRAGESEYYINRKAVRLRDIYELFLNTGVGRDGYSIIGQGKIAEMVSRKSEERRTVFEDASGIAKFRHKKSETERKLAATEDNMTRINDIFLEVESQVGPLEKEAEKAKRAIELLDAKKKVDVQLWLYDTEKLRADITAAEENYARSSFDLQNTEEAIATLQAQDDRLYEAAQSGKQHSEALLTQIREQTNQNHTLDSQYRVAENDMAHLREMCAAAEGTIASVNRTVETEKQNCSVRGRSIEELRGQLSAAEDEQSIMQTRQREVQARGAELEEKIATALIDIRELEAEAVDVKVRLSVLQSANLTANDQSSTILAEMAEYQKISAQLR